jgi:DNA-directed RNA polymerase subunit beta
MKVTDEIVYMSADDERDHYITHAGIGMDDNGLLPMNVPTRHNGDFLEVDRERDFIDVTPRQVVGAVHLLFLSLHMMSFRSLMGSHVCRLPLVVLKHQPLNWYGRRYLRSDGRVVKAPFDGKVTVDGSKITLMDKRFEGSFLIDAFQNISLRISSEQGSGQIAKG